MAIKHISLDFWNTIGIPNSAYALKRTELIANVCDITYKCAAARYTKVKEYLDLSASEFGISFTTERCWEILLDAKLTRAQIHEVKIKAQVLFLNNPPIILNETIKEINRLKEKGITVSIGSNTNFIEGQTIVCVPEVYKLSHVSRSLSFSFFSDQLPVAKPHTDFFKRIIDETNLLPEEICHIGDSSVCDYWGAKHANLHAHLIEGAFELPSILSKF